MDWSCAFVPLKLGLAGGLKNAPNYLDWSGNVLQKRTLLSSPSSVQMTSRQKSSDSFWRRGNGQRWKRLKVQTFRKYIYLLCCRELHKKIHTTFTDVCQMWGYSQIWNLFYLSIQILCVIIYNIKFTTKQKVVSVSCTLSNCSVWLTITQCNAL